MFRILSVVSLVAVFWALTYVLPRSAEQQKLIAVIGQAAGTPIVPAVKASKAKAKLAVPVPVGAKAGKVIADADLTRSLKAAGLKSSKDLNAKNAVSALGVPSATAVFGVKAGGNDAGSVTLVKAPAAGFAEPDKAPANAPADTELLDTGEQQQLALKLQQELRRVGCYSGKVNGRWTAKTKSAMARFTARINTSMPVDAPDFVLLTLVEKFDDRACGTPCGTNASPNTDGVCVAKAGGAAKAVIVAAAEPDLAVPAVIVPAPVLAKAKKLIVKEAAALVVAAGTVAILPPQPVDAANEVAIGSPDTVVSPAADEVAAKLAFNVAEVSSWKPVINLVPAVVANAAKPLKKKAVAQAPPPKLVIANAAEPDAVLADQAWPEIVAKTENGAPAVVKPAAAAKVIVRNNVIVALNPPQPARAVKAKARRPRLNIASPQFALGIAPRAVFFANNPPRRFVRVYKMNVINLLALQRSRK